MKRAISALALVCMLSSLAFSATSPDQAGSLRYRPGLRNSSGSQRLSAAQLQQLLDSLRHKTGLIELGFDEAGFLTLGDRTRLAGGSATARELLVATVDGRLVFELEAYNNSPDLAFAYITGGMFYSSQRTQARIEVRQVQLDFGDFGQLNGARAVLAAFDCGFAVLHELAHGVWRLRDAVGDSGRTGECDQQINRMRRELGLPERLGYAPRVWPAGRSTGGHTLLRAELVFVRAGQKSGRSERLYLSWEVEQVSRTDKSASHRSVYAGIVTAAR